eukprot:CAMPEP_0198147134 /NCGR_PEP_ID=MMETSP1443-20131203/33334_1 /TAXON_ID=186043 /ORGANISM="Entomoneis sp., Strain CCMP2396" /LENGTH=438 /DNA_ID=CAMNT_0043811303 /DNA_START=253 /DNA_END=1566 /DNA_ORIENTATION=+
MDTQHLAASVSSTSTDVATELDSLFQSLEVLPKMIVFDLDNTLWTPELYQIRQRQAPRVNKDIRLFDDARLILEYFAKNPNKVDIQFALASRTNKSNWAHQLLDDFSVTDSNGDKVSIRSLFPFIEIQTGSKKTHFAKLRQDSGLAYSQMLFLDDDVRMNLNEISQMGILCCHTPRGVTMGHFMKAVQKYSELKAGHDDKHWMGYILDHENLGLEEPQTVQAGSILNGRIKFFSPQKKFGFITDVDSNQEFFFHESKVPGGMMPQTGDLVVFESSMDGGGRPSAVILSSGKTGTTTSSTISKASSVETVEMPCFSMSQPFAALLLNGVKTVESRRQPMFQDLKPGTRVLLSCGRKDWPDQQSFRQILAEDGSMSEKEIQNAGRLPKGFRKGDVVGVITIGNTRLTNAVERNNPKLQRQVLAYADGIGKCCTEITQAQW